MIKENIPSTFATEALVYIQAMQMGLGLDLGIRAMEVEGDSLTVVKKAQMDEEDRSEISTYIKDAKSLSKESQTCIFIHASRLANGVVHLLATEWIKRMEQTYLMNGVLSFANAVVEIDRQWTKALEYGGKQRYL